MKTINLLKEGHGLRYDPAPPDSEEPSARGPSGRPSQGSKGPAAGKIIVLLAVLALLGGGGWWAYRSFDTLAPRIAAIRASLLRSKEKPPAQPEAPQKALSEAPPAAAKTAQAPAPETQPPPKAATLASDVGLWYRADKDYPYAIVVASFRKEESAAAYSKKLIAGGHAPTVSPTDLGDKGQWFRVVLGRYADLADVREANSRLKESQSFKDTWATKLPYAVEVASEPDKASAESALAALAGKGTYAVLFPEASGPDQPVSFRLLAGAFSSKAQADAFASSLKQRGVTSKVVSP